MAEPLGVYIHWPFCPKICPYCDFNVYKQKEIDVSRWQSAYASELRRAHARVPDRELVSIYLGGGTPSSMPVELAASLLSEVTELWPAHSNLEVTLESNPTLGDAEKFEAFRRAGVNRLSLGVQSFDDRALSFLGRWHSAEEAREAYEIARRAFSNVSMDMIYALPFQTEEACVADLRHALALAPDHLSLYQLTVEPGTAFASAVRRGRWAELDGDEAATFYEKAQMLCAEAGLPAYEVSNHALPQYQSRHNMLYWQYQEYVGIGPGAHGRLRVDGIRYETLSERSPERWLAAASKGTDECVSHKALSLADERAERVLMGLRLIEGIDRDAIDNADALATFVREGFLKVSGDRVCASLKGRLVLNRLVAELTQTSQ